MTRACEAKRRAGHALIFMVMTMVILVFVVLWAYDVHKTFQAKTRTQNGGDAAAVAAARWQGISLNLIGDLNLLHALALMTTNSDQTVAAITNMQARLCFTGPLVGLMAAQQAAKNNGVYANDGFTGLLGEHAERVRTSYGAMGDDGRPIFPEPYDGAWADYATMLSTIAGDGIAAGPDNAHYYSDASGAHPLLLIEFYEAIAGRIWCWFHLEQPGLLESYTRYSGWGPLPEDSLGRPMNSEIFGLGLETRDSTLRGLGAEVDADDLAQDRLGRDLTVAMRGTRATWYCYGWNWTNWGEMSLTGDDYFPIAGPVKGQYDYAGADVVVRIESPLERVSPGTTKPTNTLIWTAAAKPFGSLNDLPPTAYGLVLPVFSEARLIPVDAASRPSGGSFNVAWYRHIHEHLPEYMDNGQGSPGCWYCSQLAIWENEAFRNTGITWLEENGDQCQNFPPGPGPSGGTRTGH